MRRSPVYCSECRKGLNSLMAAKIWAEILTVHVAPLAPTGSSWRRSIPHQSVKRRGLPIEKQLSKVQSTGERRFVQPRAADVFAAFNQSARVMDKFICRTYAGRRTSGTNAQSRSGSLDKAIDDPLLASFVEQDGELVAIDQQNVAIAELLVEDAIASSIGRVTR
jgi:hypothetical protein